MLRQWRSSLALALAAVLALSACTYDTDAPVRGEPAPEPTPTGALYSRVMHADGYSAPRSSVSVYLYDVTNDVKAVTATMSLGFFCLLPGPFCPRPVSAYPDDQGLWSLEQDELDGDGTAGLQASATLHLDDSEFGPSTTLTLPASDADGPRRVPDLVYWEPELTVTGEDGLLRVSWPAATGVPTGEEVTYTVVSASTERSASEPQLLAGPTTATTAEVDARVYADAQSELMVVAQTTTTVGHERVEATYRSAGVPQPAGLTPASRDAECLAEDKTSGQLERAVSPCPITDGDVEWAADDVRLPTDCTREAATGGPTAGAAREETDGGAGSGPGDPCTEPSHPRVCVVLPEPHEVSLVVVRSPFSADGADVELLDAEQRIVRSHTVRGDAFDEVYPVRFEEPVKASLVCVRDDAGISGSLSEVAVW